MWITDNVGAFFWADKLPELVAVSPESPYLTQEKVYLTRQDDHELLSRLNHWIDQMFQEGAFLALQKKWIGKAITALKIEDLRNRSWDGVAIRHYGEVASLCHFSRAATKEKLMCENPEPERYSWLSATSRESASLSTCASSSRSQPLHRMVILLISSWLK